MQIDIDWYPQPRQLEMIDAAGYSGLLNGADVKPPAARVIGYGGSAFGGKTDALLGLALLAGWRFPGCNIGFFRRTFPELEGPGGAIERSRQLMAGWAAYRGDQHRWTWPTGSILQFCHCQREPDVYRYQSQQFDLMLIDEATHFTEFQVDYLMTRNRATVDGITPLLVLATNPGNVGHLWFRAQFVDLGEWGKVHTWQPGNRGAETHLFVRAQLDDNVIGNERDPGYRQTLLAQPKATRRALLHGDWDVFEGQYFSEWRRDRHVIEPQEIPNDWIRWRAVDWGYAAPFCCLWLARNPNTDETWVYRELYQSQLTDPDQAQAIADATAGRERIEYSIADPSMWTVDSHAKETTSSFDVYRENGIHLTKADNRRINGWRRVREALQVNGKGTPRLKIFSTCNNLIRTLPALIHDTTHVEDVDTDGEDHAADALRYGLGWKLIKPRPAPRKQKSRWADLEI